MNIARVATTLLLAPFVSLLSAQPSPTAPIVDVHAAPYRPSITYTTNISKQRFDIRNATIVNLIDFAHGRPDDDGREDARIVGGPTWIDLDRFDVAAIIPSLKAAGPNPGPRENSEEMLQPIVERILAERFHLKYHTEDRPLPGYTMTAGKDGAKLTEAKDPTAPGGCQSSQDNLAPGQMLLTCTSETLRQFLTMIGPNFRYPIIDRTGLTKPYDFALRFSSDQMQTREDTIHSYIDALGKQLSLVVAPGDVPQPAIMVDSVDRTPTPNAPDIAKLIPALPDLEFEVASIRPANGGPQDLIRPAGSQITLTGFNIQGLLTRAFQLPTGAMLGDALPKLSPTRYTILVKLPPEMDARAIFEDEDQFDNMLRKLLIDRFQIRYHWGEQTQEGYVLLPGTPKMKVADPRTRTYCKYGPVEGEKDVRRTESAFNGMFHCQNVTMAQFADLAQAMAKSEIKNRVPDKTGLTGSYDFTLYFTTGRKLRTDAAAADATARQAGDTAAPVAGLSIEDAFRKQLGLKLEKQSGPYPTLILDQIGQSPTEN